MDPKNFIKKISQYSFFLVILLIFVLLFTCQSHATAKATKDPLEQKQKELNKIYRELIRQREKLKLTKIQEKNVKQKLFIINYQLKKTKEELDRAQSQIFRNERKIGVLSVSLDDAQKKMEGRSSFLTKRLKEIYKSRGINYLELIVASDTLADFISRTYFFEKILNRDLLLMDEIKTQHKKIKTDKTLLENTTSQVKVLARFIEDKKQYIEKQAEEKQQVFKLLEEKRIEYEKHVSALEEASVQIESLIKKYLAERAKKGPSIARGSGTFIWPVRGRLTSFFGYRRSPFSRGSHLHTGLDIANSYGTPIQSADGGEVIFSGWWNGYGKAVIIDNGRNISTVYAHMSRIYVQKGQAIAKGQVIGLLGSTGYSTGPHLHFEVRHFGKPQNPMRWLP